MKSKLAANAINTKYCSSSLGTMNSEAANTTMTYDLINIDLKVERSYSESKSLDADHQV
jgi:hypothetical protein